MATRKGSSSKTTKGAAKKSTGARKGGADERKRAGERSRKGGEAGGRKTSGAARSRKVAGKSASGRGGAGGARGGGSGRKAAAARKGSAGSRGRTSAGRGRAARANALAMLKDDHDRVQEMFDRFERARSDDQKQQLADRICEELTLHAEIEEEIFYPAVREATGDEDLMDEAEVEHATAKELIAQIQAGKLGDPQWEAKVTVLGEYVRHHIKEEQKEMFPKARQAKLDLRALGEQIAARKAGGSSGMSQASEGREGQQGGSMSGQGGEGEQDENREPGLIESAVRTLLPGGR